MGISVMFIYVIPACILRIPLAVIIGPMTRDKLPDYVLTLPDMIEYFYDKRSKFVAGITVAVCILYDAALLFAIGEVLHLVTGINLWVAMGVAGLIIMIYTSLSGLWGLAVTDMIQFAVMTISAGVLAFGIVSVSGGIPVVYEAIKAVDPVLLTPKGHNSALDILAWVIAAASLYVSAQSYQRFGAAKGGAEVKVAYSWMLIIGTCFSAVMVLSGMAASVMFPSAASPAEGFWAAVFTVLPRV
jgi:SSS family solute:Na+ symporter